MSFTRDDERDYDRRQERIAEAKDRHRSGVVHRQFHEQVVEEKNAEIARLRSELDHLRGWREGAELGAEEARKEIARLEKMVGEQAPSSCPYCGEVYE